MMKSKKTSVNEVNFWNQFAGKGEDECWETTASKTKNGYGRIWVYPKLVYAHRVAWELVNGTIPKGMFVCHKCDNPPCCNPNHLFLGTHIDNMRDSQNKGRNNHGPVMYGERHPLSKLTQKDVDEIRASYIKKPRVRNPFGITSLAKKYCVAKSLIHRIVVGKSWPEIQEAP